MTTLVYLASRLTVPVRATVVAAPTTTTDLVALLGGPARRLVVGGISGTLVLTQRDGTTLTLSANQLYALQGVVEHVCTHVQSAACTDILAQR
jgi:hypothetical protein